MSALTFSAAYLRSKPVKSEPEDSPDPLLINLGVPENRLMADFLLPKLRSLPSITEATLTYAGLRPSSTTLLPNLCAFYRDYLGIADAKPRSFVLCHGAAGVLESLGRVFLDPGDLVVLPAPVYTEFFKALERFRPQFLLVDPSNLPDPPARAKLLVVHNPGVPVGERADPALVSWGLRIPGCQILVDESYALCAKRGGAFASLYANADPARVHHCYGLSGDWGMAGIPCGFFCTRSRAVLRAVDFAGGTAGVSAPVLRAAEAIFADAPFVAEYARALSARLAEAEAAAAAALVGGGLAVVAHPAGLFLTLDLSGRIQGEEAERALLARARAAGVRVALHGGGRGFVAVACAAPRAELEEGCRRIVGCLR
jgi:histidinol-phosphate/aromatic aminotransferase/cobyric acid decarboxylase-like protein